MKSGPATGMMTYLKKASVLAALVIAVAFQAPGAAASGLDISARAAVVMDADTGEIVISKNMDKRLPPASTAKVMTAILALEKLEMDKSLKVSGYAASKEPTKVNLKRGDEVTVEALMYSLLLKSANDAATVLAEGIAGTEAEFARMMTEKAAAMGARNTTFKTASGLPAKGQYTTAYDLALMLRYALDVPGFVDIASTRYATLKLGKKDELALKNSNKLLWIYDGAVAGKTGYTRSARDCYVGEAACGGRRLIVSLLGSEVRWEDATRLLDMGFELAGRGEAIVLNESSPRPKNDGRVASAARPAKRAKRSR